MNGGGLRQARSGAVACGRGPKAGRLSRARVGRAVPCGQTSMSQLFTRQFLPDWSTSSGNEQEAPNVRTTERTDRWERKTKQNKTKKDKEKGERRVEEMTEVGSWQLQSFPPQTIKEEWGRSRPALQCLEEADSIYVFLYETQRTHSKNKPRQ